MIRSPVNRESCLHCHKQIYTHNPIIICPSCSIIVHSQCSDDTFQIGENGQWYCLDCAETSGMERYNPFSKLCVNIDSDHEYDTEPINSLECVTKISSILDECQNYKANELKSKLSYRAPNNKTTFSTLFLNIDGNATNFDEFSATLKVYDHEFSIISIAETNITEFEKDMYPITNYTSIYQSKISNKRKGTGVGMYIHNKYSFTQLAEHSICTPNIETLFITITNTSSPIAIGVVYRPPNGSKNKFISGFEQIITKLPEENVYIMGDFNINIHNINNNEHAQFEETFITAGFAPLISLVTHGQTGCKKTCIDNIFCNSFDNITFPGLLTDRLSHHLPIFSISEIEHELLDNPIECKPKEFFYDYCNDNTEKFVDKVIKTFSSGPEYNYNFTGFAKSYVDIINETCLSKTKSNSKRTTIANPWITPCIIDAVKTKHKLYQNWKKSVSKSCKLGNSELHLKYKNYRRTLKHLIKTAKSNYYNIKFEKSKGNLKKTWKLINDLRGKKKINLSATFIIDSQTVCDRRTIANKFNDYFTSIALDMNNTSDLEHGIPISEVPDFSTFIGTPLQNSIFIENCDHIEIDKLISELSNGTASDGGGQPN